jgi:quercetin dioxygenase-like cupin family protein
MDRATFEAALQADGFAGPLDRRMEPGASVPEHAHRFDARLLILEGEFILGQGGETRRYGPGEMFELPANIPHTEDFGPQGATYLVGRRQVP